MKTRRWAGNAVVRWASVGEAGAHTGPLAKVRTAGMRMADDTAERRETDATRIRVAPRTAAARSGGVPRPAGVQRWLGHAAREASDARGGQSGATPATVSGETGDESLDQADPSLRGPGAKPLAALERRSPSSCLGTGTGERALNGQAAGPLRALPRHIS